MIPAAPPSPPAPPANAHVPRWVRAALGPALVLLVVVVAAWALTPGTLRQRLPGDEALGTPALGSSLASRDYDIRDEAATQAQREAAAQAERPVFDWDGGAREDAVQRARTAFAAMRDAAAEAARRPAERRGSREELAEVRRREDLEDRLGVVVGDHDFAALAEDGFSQRLEDALAELAGRGLAGYLVEDPGPIAAADRGIVVRTVRRGAEPEERVLTDVDQVRSVHLARDEVARAASSLPGLGGAQRLAVGHLATAMIRPTLVFDLAETARRQQEASDRAKPVIVHVRRGELIVADGEIIEPRHVLIFRGIREQTRSQDVLLVRLGAALLVAVLLLLLWRHVRNNARGFRPQARDAVLLAAALLFSTGLGAAGLAAGDALHERFPHLAPEVFFYLVPFATGALVIRSVLAAEVALAFAVASGALIGLVAGSSILVALHAILTSALAAGLVLRTRSRRALFKVGAAVGGVGALLVTGTHLFSGRGLGGAAPLAAAAAFSGALLLPLVTMLTLPLVQRVFGYLTDLRLLELANLNHPALKDLIIQAPGTYHHAVIMGGLAEAAARAIGANPLLARVGAYYHDLGKIRNPIYFGENQRGDNRHDELAPAMSALIVKRHVSDGVEVARHWGLPREVVDIIRQHHGTRLVSFFWAKALSRQREPGGEGPPDEAVFRYPGPRPQTREAALVMIADVCEATARALSESTPEELQALVSRRINEIFAEGQLDECELTLRDLKGIAGALASGLIALHGAQRDATPGRPPGAPAVEPTPLQLVGVERPRS